MDASEEVLGAMYRQACALAIPETREMGLVPTLAPTFSFRCRGGRLVDGDVDRVLPVHVVAQLDTHRDLLRGVPGIWSSELSSGQGATATKVSAADSITAPVRAGPATATLAVP